MTKTTTADGLRNDRLLRALAREPVDVTPVWIMRQAGRYLPEYRAIRARAGSFMGLCTNPELACEVTLQPLERFELDAAIIFSDILTIPHAMGLGLHFVEGEGPRFEHPIQSARDIKALPELDPETELKYVMDALRVTRRELDGRVPLIGFSGSPWTLATYMIEGQSPGEFKRAKRMLFDAPLEMHSLLDKLAISVTAYMNAQIKAGAQCLMLFDTWGGALSARDYEEFSLRYLSAVVAGLERDNTTRAVPIIVFTKNGGLWLEKISECGCDGVGLDWTIDLGRARASVGERVALQGNLDPCVLYASPERIREQVGYALERYGHGPGHVFNLGHGIHPGIEPDHVRTLVDAVHELSRPYHGNG